MSKGSNQRPGEGYADNWEKIFSNAKVSPKIRPTKTQAELIDIDVEMPTSGSRVLALTLGGTLAQTVWTSDSHKYFLAWSVYPKIPKSVKEKMCGNEL